MNQTFKKIKNSIKKLKLEELNKIEMVILFWIPILSILVFLISNKTFLMLNVKEYSLLTIIQTYTKIITHIDILHVVISTLLFIMLIISLTTFYLHINQKESYFKVLKKIFLFTPIFTTISQVIVYALPNRTLGFIPPNTVFGMSGIISALIGMSCVSFLHYAKLKFKINNEKGIEFIFIYLSFAFFLIYFNTLLVEYIFNLVFIIGLFTTASFMFVVFTFQKDPYVDKLMETFIKEKNKIVKKCLLLFLILGVLSPILLFPKNIIIGSSIVDIIGHASGFVSGVLISYSTLK